MFLGSSDCGLRSESRLCVAIFSSFIFTSSRNVKKLTDSERCGMRFAHGRRQIRYWTELLQSEVLQKSYDGAVLYGRLGSQIFLRQNFRFIQLCTWASFSAHAVFLAFLSPCILCFSACWFSVKAVNERDIKKLLKLVQSKHEIFCFERSGKRFLSASKTVRWRERHIK